MTTTTVRSEDGDFVAHVNEFEFWSPLLGVDAVRVSMYDARGGEFFMVVPADDYATYRRARLDAAMAIDQAISQGLDPGEVRVLQ